MDAIGIWAQVLYPNVAGFGSQRFLRLGDDELKLICVRAYNDFLRDWASADHRRLLTVMTTPFWDVDAAVAEIERGAAAGHRGILFTGEPRALRPAPPRRSALGPVLGGRPGHRAAGALPPRQRRHRHVVHAGPHRRPRHRVDVRVHVDRAVPEERAAGRRPADERRAAQVPRGEVRVGRERDRLDPVRARSGRPRLPRGSERPDQPVGADALGVLRPPGVRVLLVRDGRASSPARRHPGRQRAVRDRLPAPDVPVRQRPREDRGQPGRRVARDPAQVPVGERGEAVRGRGADGHSAASVGRERARGVASSVPDHAAAVAAGPRHREGRRDGRVGARGRERARWAGERAARRCQPARRRVRLPVRDGGRHAVHEQHLHGGAGDRRDVGHRRRRRPRADATILPGRCSPSASSPAW